MKPILFITCIFCTLLTTAQPVIQMHQIASGKTTSDPSMLTVFNNKLYFHAADSVYGRELHCIDSNDAVTRISDINPGWKNINYSFMFWKMGIADNKLYFGADNGTNGIELFMYDGTNTPMLVQDIYPGVPKGDPGFFCTLNNQLYFTADTPGYGIELMRHDPVSNTVTRISDIAPGLLNATPRYTTAFNNKLYFGAVDPTTGVELYTYDPATNIVSMLMDIAPGASNSDPENLTVIDNKLYFTASTPSYGRELYSYDGISSPQRLTDYNSGSADGIYNLHSLIRFNDSIFFVVNDLTHGTQLGAYDLTNNIAVLSQIINPSGNASIGEMIVYKNRLYFESEDNVHGRELWAYDGKTAPSMVADLSLSPWGSTPTNFTVYAGSLYFNAFDTATGRELYKLTDTSTVPNNITIQNIHFGGDVKVYPNPAKHHTSFSLYLAKSEKLSITLTDIAGKKVYNGPLRQYSKGANTHSILLSELSPATYFYQVKNENGQLYLSGKIIKE